MRTIKLAIYVSLDGVVEAPGWTQGFWSEDLARLQADYLYASEALLLGRVTYEGFAAAWPAMEPETGEFGRKMNRMPKHVATSTLTELEWNATPLGPDPVAAVRELRACDGDDLLIYGSGAFVDALAGAGLIDEYRLMVHPVIVGSGQRLFAGAAARTLSLADSVTTTAGVAVLTYRDEAAQV